MRCFQAVVLCAVCISAEAALYFVDQQGNDGNAGTSPDLAWATLSKVNSILLQPGDVVSLEGGRVFSGELVLVAEDSGNSSAGVVVTSYGQGAAIINATTTNGLRLTDVSHVTIRNLIVRGEPERNRGNGIHCDNTSTNGMRAGLILDNVEVSGFGKHGIMITGAPFGFSNVVVTNCTMFNNVKGGMEVAGRLAWDAKHYAHADVRVTDCKAFDNPGDPTFNENHSGSGIVLYQVDGGVIERCRAWRNGAACPAKGGGPVGIWTCASRRVIIQHCESFGNLSRGLDGGGFDIDGGSEECVVQYNYSHDNRGPGLMAYTYHYASHRDRDNIIRFNISVNDALNSERYGGIWIRADGRPMTGLKVYNNTVFTTAAPAAWIQSVGVEVDLRNNILMTGSTGIPLRVDDATNAPPSIAIGSNLYWRNGTSFLVRWNEKEVTSLAGFRSIREAHAARSAGLFVDPAVSFQEADSRTNFLPNLAALAHLRPKNQVAWTGGDIIHEVHDFSGALLTNRARFPVGAFAGPITP